MSEENVFYPTDDENGLEQQKQTLESQKREIEHRIAELIGKKVSFEVAVDPKTGQLLPEQLAEIKRIDIEINELSYEITIINLQLAKFK